MSEKLTIEVVKYGKRTTKYGEKDTIGVKCKEYDKWLNGFCWSASRGLKSGDTLVVEVVESGQYLNIKAPKDDAPVNTRIATPKEPVAVAPPSGGSYVALEDFDLLVKDVQELTKRVDNAANYMREALDTKADKF